MAMDRVALASAPAESEVDASLRDGRSRQRACGLCSDAPAHVHERLGDAHRLPAAGAAALHDLRRAADGRGGLVQLLQLERLWPARKNSSASRTTAMLFGNPAFTRALINNGLIIVVSLLVQLPLALGVALLVAGRMTGAVWFRMIFFLPYILADVAAGLIWRFMFDGRYGLSRHRHRRCSGSRRSICSASTDWAFTAVLIVILWKYFGFHMMLYIAGLQGIDKSLLEAAEMDGAEPFQRFWHITLPLLGPMIRLSVFFSVVGALQLFDIIVPLTGGGPFDTTNTMVSFLYYFGITRMRVGFGSAVGVVLFVICVTFAFGYRRLFMRDD